MEKTKIPHETALRFAQEIVEILTKHTLRIQIAGSIRREKPSVGDIEILYIPQQGDHLNENELFPQSTNLTDLKLQSLLSNGTFQKRPKTNGSFTYGDRVKLLIHKTSSIPVDLFACTPENWFNNLVSRTGGKTNNILIASKAKTLGLQWLPFGPGFEINSTKELIPVTSEEDVFSITKLPFKPPKDRA